MSISQVQKQRAEATSTTCTATYDSALVQANLLYAVATKNGGEALTMDSAGWTEVANEDGNGPIQSFFYKIAGASESTTVTVSTTTTRNIRLHILEYNSTTGWPASPLDAGSVGSRSAGVSSITTPSAATTSADALLMAGVGIDVGRTMSNSWTNSFTQQQIEEGASQQLEVAHRIVTATGTYDTNEAWTGGTANARASIAAFKPAAAAGKPKVLLMLGVG